MHYIQKAEHVRTFTLSCVHYTDSLVEMTTGACPRTIMMIKIHNIVLLHVYTKSKIICCADKFPSIITSQMLLLRSL